MTFMGKAAGDFAAELQPYSVTKAPHIEILLDMLKHPAGPQGCQQDSSATTACLITTPRLQMTALKIL